MACLMYAAQSQALPPAALFTLLHVEGGTVGMARPAARGTEDLGPAQVNTEHLGRVAAAHFGGDRKAAYDWLRWNGCYNVVVGAMLLRECVDARRGDLMAGIGCYHSPDPAESMRYELRFAAKFRQVFAPPRGGR
jgi:hypothetical protein